MARKKQKGFLKFLFNLALAAILIYFVYQWLILPSRKMDYTQDSLEVDQRVDEVLVNFGVTNADILKVYREEKSIKNLKWIQVTKEVRIPQETSLAQVLAELQRQMEKQKVSILVQKISDDGKSLAIKIGVRNIILQSLLLKKKDYKTPKYKVAIIIDDLGYDQKNALKLFEIKESLTVSILPGERYSRQLAKQAITNGYEVLLHLPLEPLDYPKNNPGKRAIYMNMNAAACQKVLLNNISSIPFISGVNNHMGSRITEDAEKMKQIFNVIKDTKLYYLDSRTSPKSVAFKIAKQMGIRTAYNEVFLDNEDNLDQIKAQLEKLARLAITNGQAIAIGHIERENTILALKEVLPYFKEKGIKIVPASQLVK